ncbi:hypothetical protein AVEN_54617-1 [Araneus ventricosus]|uniref:Transposable element Tc3 transposase n=1 Tax=Araneus ventricosus TaxID=182803 RepID=A0A4Y2BL38_ARAVE|nr:hypothetical protein AVEN_54617-1 [Araneus ventricosus]
MVWAAFGFNGQVGLAFLDGRQNSPKYLESLENHLIPFAVNIGGRNWEYQHYNASIHTSNATKNYLNSKTVTALEWPPMSPDPQLRMCGALCIERYMRMEGNFRQ